MSLVRAVLLEWSDHLRGIAPVNISEFKVPCVPFEPPLNRREFLNSSAKNAATVAGVVGLSGRPSQAAAHDRVGVALIGVRNQGKTLASAFAQHPQVEVVALCDVDPTLLGPGAAAIEEIQGCRPRADADASRSLQDPAIDAVVIATPDHTHHPLALAALRAGKHVYLETPATHTLAESADLWLAAQASGRVIQCGLPQRSAAHVLSAVQYVHGGALGRVPLARAWAVHRRQPIGRKAPSDPPAGVDYQSWLGPVTGRPFQSNRFHHHWQWFWDFGSGELGHWGVQLLDVARWGLGVELPQSVVATGGTFHFDDDRETPDTLSVQYAYPQGTILWEHRQWSGQPQEGRSTAVAFYGEEGTLILDGSGWKVYGGRGAPSVLGNPGLEPHVANFVSAIRGETAASAMLDAGLTSSALCHLGNLSYREGGAWSLRALDAQPTRVGTPLPMGPQS